MQISIKSDFKILSRKLRKHKKKIKFGMKNAINATLFDVKKAEDKATIKFLDNPTPWVQRLTLVRKANTSTLRGAVYVPANKNDNLMRFHIHGGTQAAKGRSHTVPTKKTKLNRFGNLSKGNQGKAVLGKERFFSGKPHKGYTPGIYRRMGRGGRQGLRLHSEYRPSLTYKRSFPFFKIAESTANRTFKRNAERSIRREIASIR